MPLDRTPWTDETVMPWGKHKGAKLGEIPPAYLLWLFEQPWIKDWPGLHAYIRKHEDQLIAERGEVEPEEEEGGDYKSFDDYLKDYRGF